MKALDTRSLTTWTCLLLLFVPVVPAEVPPASDRTALVRVVTQWTGGCSGSKRTSWDNMVRDWYDDVSSSDHGSAAWVRDGFYQNGSIADSDFTDVDLVDWGRDEDSDRVDEPDAAMIALHGGNASEGRWAARVRVDEAGSGNCDSYQGHMEFGDGDLEFLHLSSCFSMDEDDWVDWSESFEGLHQIEGFHGLMWISSSYGWRYRRFSDDGFDTGMAVSWVDNLYKYRVVSANMCPVAIAAGHGTDAQSNAWNRINNERYNNVYSDPTTPGWFAVTYILGCNPKEKGPLPDSLAPQLPASPAGDPPGEGLMHFTAAPPSPAGSSHGGGSGDPGYVPPLDRTVHTRSSYLAMADGVLPTWDPSILAAPPGIDWIGNVSVAGIAAAVADTTPETVVVDGPRTVARDLADTKVIKIDTEEGSLRYISRPRQFDYDNDPPRAWNGASTQSLVFSAVAQLGIPSAELDPTGGGMRVDTLGGRGYDATSPTPGGDESIELERWLTIDRFVNGLPVFESQVRGAVSNNGEIARLSARWPRFELQQGLVLRGRQSVLDEIADHLWDVEFGAAIELEAQLVYHRIGDEFVPAALISLSDTESGEDLLVPLAELPPDLDQDGLADAVDNCIDVHNPGQADADGDVVGDACDNCPAVANPGQEDGIPGTAEEPDGIGDACVPFEDGCRLPDSTCEDLGPATCAAEGGVSLANDLIDQLRFDDADSLSWTAAVTITGPYALYRGSFGTGLWTYDHACFEPALALPEATDTANPSSGSGFYYLVTVQDPCGESSPGHDSDGNERPIAMACP